jgi:hypothetical protein
VGNRRLQEGSHHHISTRTLGARLYLYAVRAGVLYPRAAVPKAAATISAAVHLPVYLESALTSSPNIKETDPRNGLAFYFCPYSRFLPPTPPPPSSHVRISLSTFASSLAFYLLHLPLPHLMSASLCCCSLAVGPELPLRRSCYYPKSGNLQVQRRGIWAKGLPGSRGFPQAAASACEKEATTTYSFQPFSRCRKPLDPPPASPLSELRHLRTDKLPLL